MSFKCWYKKQIINHDFQAKLLKNTKCEITLAHAIKWMSEAWKDVKPTVIENCWRKSGVYVEEDRFQYEEIAFNVDVEDNPFLETGESELDGLVREVYPNIADEAIFEWLSANEACGQEEDELNYSVEKSLERAFDEVIGD
ncbi:hypothetical protein RCL1_007689 [Eukaryota sp. TZLM3-RCL]